MDWRVWILTSAVFLALYDLAKKASVRENAVLPVLLCSTLFGSLAFMAGLAACGRFAATAAAVDGRIVLLGAIKALIVASSWIFTFFALRTLPITIATPIRASSPALVVLAAFFIYGEVPSWTQAVGMVTVLAGYWAFSWAGKAEGIDFLHSRAVAAAVIGAVLSSSSALWDKCVFQVFGASVEPVQFVFQIGLFVVYALCIALTFAVPALATLRRAHPFRFRWTIPLVGILLAGADWLYFRGLAIPGAPISVSALLRRFSVAITFVLGAFCFREHNLLRKGIALALVLVGIALLCLH